MLKISKECAHLGKDNMLACEESITIQDLIYALEKLDKSKSILFKDANESGLYNINVIEILEDGNYVLKELPTKIIDTKMYTLYIIEGIEKDCPNYHFGYRYYDGVYYIVCEIKLKKNKQFTEYIENKLNEINHKEYSIQLFWI